VKNDPPAPSSRPPSPRDLGGRIWKCLLGLFLIAVSWALVTYLWRSYLRAAEMDAWVEAPCRIETLEVDDSLLNQRGMPKYLLKVTYRYQWNGHDYLGDRIKRLPTEASDPRKLKKKIEQYAVGTETVCWLDPDLPEMVVLKKDSKAALYTIWFPCLFMVGGAGMIVSALFRKQA
jgi:hypothetical protein